MSNWDAPTTKEVKINVRMETSLFRRVKKIADRKKLSCSQVIRAMLLDWLAGKVEERNGEG